MSAGSEIRAVEDVKVVRTRAADWILARQLAENWSEADQAALNAWLEESPSHRLAYLRLEATWQRTRRLAALRSSRTDDTGPPANAKRAFPWKTTVASAVAAIAMMAAAGAYLLQPVSKIYATAIGKHSTVAFADGSTIDLNTDTILRVSNSKYWRSATLEKGEAFFHIRHDASRPFTVTAANRRITDLGTEFTVRRGANDVTVTLLEGRARVDSANAWPGGKSAVLTPGDILRAQGDAVSVAKRPVAKLTNEIAWRRGVLVFESATLADAARELNRYNTQKVIIADDAVGRLKFDASIRTDGIDVFTRVAQQVFGLRVEMHPNEVVISR